MLWIVTKKVKCFAEPPDPVKLAIKVELNRSELRSSVKVEVAVLGSRP